MELAKILAFVFIIKEAATTGTAKPENGINLPPPSAYKKEADWKQIIKDSKLMTRDHGVDWGISTKPVFCPGGTYAWGYITVKSTAQQGFNRIDLLCYGGTDGAFHHSKAYRIYPNFNITFQQRNFQVFQYTEELRLCEFHQGPLREFRMSYHDTNIPAGQEIGVFGFQGVCWNGKVLDDDPGFANVYFASDMYRTNGTCEKGSAVCGFKLRYQIEVSYTSLVDADLFCCNLVTPVESCQYSQKYKIAAAVDNRKNSHATQEKLTITHKIELTTSVRQEDSLSWDSSNIVSISDEYIRTRLQELSKSEVNRKFDRAPTFMGMMKGLGDIATGITGFLKKAGGRLLNAAGLGEMFGVAGLRKLVGESGIENILQLDEAGIEFYYKNLPFGNFLKSNIGGIFENLNAMSQPDRLVKTLSFQGYTTSIENMGSLLKVWTGAAHTTSMSKVIGKSVTFFREMNLHDLFGIYGLMQLYGKNIVNDMANNGQLAKAFAIGPLAGINWIDGLDKIKEMKNIGHLFKIFVCGWLFCSKGIATEFALDDKLALSGLTQKTQEVENSFQSVGDFSAVQWIYMLTISFLHKILEDADDPMLVGCYEKSQLASVLGPNGLQTILNNPNLKSWVESIENTDEKLLLHQMALVGLQPMSAGFAAIMASSRFKKIIGSSNLQEILGSARIENKVDLAKLIGLFGIRNIFGDTKNVQTPEHLNESLRHSVMENENLGTIFGLYSLGQMAGLKHLDLVAGSGPRNLKAIDNIQSDGSTEGKRVRRGLLGDLGKSALGGLTQFVGGPELFNTLLGSGKAAPLAKNEKTEEEKRSLEEKYSNKVKQTAKDSQGARYTLSQQIKRSESNITTETIDNVYDANILTLVVIPSVQCDDYYSIDILDRKNYITILVPDSGKCEPEIGYRVPAVFNYLKVPFTEKRIFYVDVGTEWTPIHQYQNKPEIRDLLLKKEPTRGMYERIKTYAEGLQGDGSIELRQILGRDLETTRVWDIPDTFEAEVEVAEFNYNIVLQHRLKCDDMITYSAQPTIFRFPSIFGCTSQGVWQNIPMGPSPGGGNAYVAQVGLRKGGRDVNLLTDKQRNLPEVNEQLRRMLQETQSKFITETLEPIDNVFWKRDTTLLRNPAWDFPILERDVIDVSDKGTDQITVLQLVAKCGPIEIPLRKFKVTYVQSNRSKMVPPNALLPEDIPLAVEEECAPHFPCE